MERLRTVLGAQKLPDSVKQYYYYQQLLNTPESIPPLKEGPSGRQSFSLCICLSVSICLSLSLSPAELKQGGVLHWCWQPCLNVRMNLKQRNRNQDCQQHC